MLRTYYDLNGKFTFGENKPNKVITNQVITNAKKPIEELSLDFNGGVVIGSANGFPTAQGFIQYSDVDMKTKKEYLVTRLFRGLCLPGDGRMQIEPAGLDYRQAGRFIFTTVGIMDAHSLFESKTGNYHLTRIGEMPKPDVAVTLKRSGYEDSNVKMYHPEEWNSFQVGIRKIQDALSIANVETLSLANRNTIISKEQNRGPLVLKNAALAVKAARAK